MKSRVVLLCVCVLGIVALVLLLNRPREPGYHGHPISYWIEPWQHHGRESAENIAAAYSAMDEQAVRWLAGQLNWRPSGVRATVNRLVARVISAKLFDDPPDRRETAAMGLGRLGPRARSAVPALEAVWRRTAELRAGSARAASLGALIRIRGGRLDPYLEKLRDPAAADWQIHAWAMGHLGTNAAPSVPFLVQALAKPAHEGIVLAAVWALAGIHSQPELTVPALAVQVGHSSPDVRRNAIRGLAAFGPAAKPAWAALTLRLQSPEPWLRVAITNALKQIDAEAARQQGVN
jgi:HEAT repeat protein